MVVMMTRYAIGAILLLSIVNCPRVEGTESNGADPSYLRPQHINVDGDQNIIEKAFIPGSLGADNLSHARRSTVYLGGAQPTIPGPRTGFHRTEEIIFTSQASAFMYAYPTPKSKTAIENQVGDNESLTQTADYGVWIVTCKHAVNKHAFIGVRLNTITGSNITYLTEVSSWKQSQRADVAVLKFEEWRNREVDLAMFEYWQAADNEKLVSNTIYEGTPVALTGFPVGMLTSTIRNYPVVQYGYIAQIQGYLTDDQNHNVFLVGGAAFPGNSGGPVLIPAGTPKAVTQYFKRGLLVGMVCAQRLAPTVTVEGVNYVIKQSAYLAEVVPMAAIHEAIEQSGEW